MNRKTAAGILGALVGGIWLYNNFQYFDEQGFVAIGMPLIISIVGWAYIFMGLKSKD